MTFTSGKRVLCKHGIEFPQSEKSKWKTIFSKVRENQGILDQVGNYKKSGNFIFRLLHVLVTFVLDNGNFSQKISILIVFNKTMSIATCKIRPVKRVQTTKRSILKDLIQKTRGKCQSLSGSVKIVLWSVKSLEITSILSGNSTVHWSGKMNDASYDCSLRTSVLSLISRFFWGWAADVHRLLWLQCYIYCQVMHWLVTAAR